jgi:N-acetyl sugar amidotransferase
MKQQICTRCILDSTDPNIVFDNNGVCNYCIDYDLSFHHSQRPAKEKEPELLKIIAQIKEDGKNKKYNCIIGLSGGVDSSYVAYLVKKIYGLTPIAIHLDNGWNAELAVNNIENICKKLDIDLLTHVIDWEEFRDLQLSFLKSSVANAEIPSDHAIYSILFNKAQEFGIKWIIDGVNHSTEYVRKGVSYFGYAHSDLTHLKAIHKEFGTSKLKSYPKLSLWKKLYLKHVKKVTQFSILDYVDYHKKDAQSLLESELSWRSYGAKHHESLFTKWHQCIHLIKKFGYDKRKIHYSDMILSGQITREETMINISKPSLPPNEAADLEQYVMKKLNLNKDEYEKILNAKPKDYSVYKNDKWIMDLYAKFKK